MRKKVRVAALALALCAPWSARAAGAQAVTFEELWSHALEHAPQLEVVRARRMEAEAARAHARGVLADNPTLSLQGGPRFQGQGRSWDLAVLVSQPVRMAGERHDERELARATGARVDAETGAALWEARLTLREAYRRALCAQEHASLARASLAFEERVFTLVQKRVKAGETSPLELRLAEVSVLEAREAALGADQQLSEARLTLAQSSGWDVLSPPELSGTLTRAQLPPLASLLADAQARAPQLALVRTRAREAEARRALSDTERAPVPELGGGYVREGSTPVAGPVSHSAILTFAMPVPLWSHNQGRRADARANEAVAHAVAAAEAQRLRADVARLHARVASDAQRLDLYTGGLLPKFDEQLAQLERALALGELDLFALTTLRERVLAAQHALVEVRAAYAASLSELERTVGFELPVAGAAP